LAHTAGLLAQPGRVRRITKRAPQALRLVRPAGAPGFAGGLWRRSGTTADAKPDPAPFSVRLARGAGCLCSGGSRRDQRAPR